MAQVTVLPNEICQLPNLKVLNAGYNQLTELPEEIGDLSNLQELHLHFNGDTHTPSAELRGCPCAPGMQQR